MHRTLQCAYFSLFRLQRNRIHHRDTEGTEKKTDQKSSLFSFNCFSVTSVSLWLSFSEIQTTLRNKKSRSAMLGTCGSLLLNCAKKNARRGCAGKRPRSRRRLFSSSAASGHKSQVRSILLRARTRYKQDPVRNPAFFGTSRNNPAMWSEPES
jgi:hypothetical protein